ncbi:MAG: hypothetical protein U1F83_16990 [Verrucomicrobiota bacterium]
MKNPNSTDSQNSSPAAAPPGRGFSPWQQLKNKRISYFAVPLLVMATVVEFVILATGWKYQQVACLPQGMGVTFFGIGPIGATILAVELLKLPLAVWTAARVGWTKRFMLICGLPLICVLTFQLVKDMAVYEMGIAMKPASEMLAKASTEEIKIAQLNGELAAIEAKKTERQHKLAELATKKAKAKAELDENLKRIDETRQDAITLTDYQKKELAEEESRQAAITKQYNADAETLTKAVADLRARREVELPRAAQWNAEEARIENVYKAKLADYTNKKKAYEKDKAEYEHASFIMRQLMKEPVDPGVAPERTVNTILKPTVLAELDEQIKSKEAELLAVNNKRRERTAQVGDSAQRLRQEFDTRSRTKREEADRNRAELLAAYAAQEKEWKAEEKQMDTDLAGAVQNVDGLRAQVDSARKTAEGYYEAREAAIRNTQVHRIATTVEIVRGLIFGERPMSITASAKERGDILTDQISMVRIWVYPVLAFIVAFLPTLMVEIACSTVFLREEQTQRKPHRLGLFGRGLHQLYIRAGRLKVMRAERKAAVATAEISSRDRAVAEAKAAATKAQAEKEAESAAAQQAITAAAAAHEEQLKWMKAEHEEQLKEKESEWVEKFGGIADALNKSAAEKDALRDFQKAEIERQVQARQHAWTERVSQLQHELDTQRAAHEAERAALIKEQQQKLREVAEDYQTQTAHFRRQASGVELAAQEATAKLQYDLKQAVEDRDAARQQMQHQTESLEFKLTQAKEEAARELDKALRQEKYKLERQQMEFTKTLREKDEAFERQLQQREQELALAADERRAKDQLAFEQDARRREENFEREVESRINEVNARWNQDAQQRDETAQVRQKQREQELAAKASQELRRREAELERQMQQREQELTLAADERRAKDQLAFEQDSRRREENFEREVESRIGEVNARWEQEAQQREEAAMIRQKQREQEVTAKAGQELRRREAELERQLEAQAREAETRLKQELQQKELAFEAQLKQREQELAAKAVARETALQSEWTDDLRAHEQEWERQAEARVRATEARLGQEARQKDEIFEVKLRQREQQLLAEFEARQAEFQTQTQHFHRRREEESADASQRSLRELEVQLRQEMQQKEEAVLAKAKQREQELLAQLSAQTETHKQAQHQWETEFHLLRRNIEPLNELLKRTEQERDEAKQSATEHFIKVQDMEKKLTEASSVLTGWKNGNGKSPAATRAGRDVLEVTRTVLAASGDR